MKYFSEVYSEPCETSKMDLFAKIVNGDNFCDFGTGDEGELIRHNQVNFIKVNKGNTKKSFEICLKLTIKTPE